MRTHLLQYTTARTNIPAQAIPNCSYHNPKQEEGRERSGQNMRIQNSLGINGIHGLLSRSSSKDQMHHQRGALLLKTQQAPFIQNSQLQPLPLYSCYTAAHSRTEVKLPTVDVPKKELPPSNDVDKKLVRRAECRKNTPLKRIVGRTEERRNPSYIWPQNERKVCRIKVTQTFLYILSHKLRLR